MFFNNVTTKFYTDKLRDVDVITGLTDEFIGLSIDGKQLTCSFEVIRIAQQSMWLKVMKCAGDLVSSEYGYSPTITDEDLSNLIEGLCYSTR